MKASPWSIHIHAPCLPITMYIGVEAGSTLVPEERWLSCDWMRLVGCIIMPGICGRFGVERSGFICDMSCSIACAEAELAVARARPQNSEALTRK